MSECQTELLIKNQKGLHARAAAAFVKCAEQFDAEVTVEKGGQVVSGDSILGLMMLSASKGSTIYVKTIGNEAEKALSAITLLVDSLFGEEQ
ncbi:MAG: HPr family phosphocarrier protein [Alphaproteobacteria bacterium]|jgi:phosphocarrier protein|nr:HPr family phosphocarrier protein [Alphaproteobacteria bacterium]MBR3661693.1 HPr family phosphocarrier protein [Alphaproteobacteria bacterium]